MLALLLKHLGFVLFGLSSLNLPHRLGANFEFLAARGFDAVREGVRGQLPGLVLSGRGAAACYIVFKLCEKVLVERLSIDHNKE